MALLSDDFPPHNGSRTTEKRVGQRQQPFAFIISTISTLFHIYKFHLSEWDTEAMVFVCLASQDGVVECAFRSFFPIISHNSGPKQRGQLEMMEKNSRPREFSSLNIFGHWASDPEKWSEKSNKKWKHVWEFIVKWEIRALLGPACVSERESEMWGDWNGNNESINHLPLHILKTINKVGCCINQFKVFPLSLGRPLHLCC